MKRTVTFGETMLRLKTPEAYEDFADSMHLRQVTEAQKPM